MECVSPIPSGNQTKSPSPAAAGEGLGQGVTYGRTMHRKEMWFVPVSIGWCIRAAGR